MKTKKEIVSNWLPRYTGNALEDFGARVAGGGTEELITMASTQAASLHMLFAGLAGRAMENTNASHFDAHMKLRAAI